MKEPTGKMNDPLQRLNWQAAFPEERADFVKEMYRVYWSNMGRSMDGVWKILAPITVAGTLIVGVHRDFLPASLGVSLAILVIIWGINVTIDLNAWHRRNLLFATKAEQQFLHPSDYGHLLPSVYTLPSKEWITFYLINVLIFVAFLVLVALYGAMTLLRRERWLPALVLLVGILGTSWNVWKQERSAGKRLRELFAESEPERARSNKKSSP